MQASTNKRKEENIETKLSRQARMRKNKKLRHDQKQTEMLCELNIDIPLITDDIIFDPSRHRIQSATRKISTKDSIYYLEREWTSIPLCSSDRISTKKNKTRYDISARELLIETLIREAKSSDSNSLELLKIPLNFLSLIYTNIIKETNGIIEKSLSNTTNNRLWVAFGRWLGLKKQNSPLKRKHIRQHLRLLWKRLRHAHDIQSDRDFQGLFDTATAYNTKKEKVHLIISACHSPKLINELVQFKHITEPECITDLSNQTLVHLEQLGNYNAVILATDINFTKVYKKAGIKKGPIVSEQDLNNAQGLNRRKQLLKPKAKQIQIPSAVSDRRRGYIDLARARQGLNAEDSLSDLY
ncbi:calnexin independence factor cif1 [Gigaspora margarita]|uniref:Calnexin independence factor cif1 n=1 Tax=Gigaspora margarita TaxID=4874 RepID=A0A8H3X888_GIGMA|nr:calnexin independence factor cif1 [Gigaspora margarita]